MENLKAMSKSKDSAMAGSHSHSRQELSNVFKSSLANPKLGVTQEVTKRRFENGSNCSEP